MSGLYLIWLKYNLYVLFLLFLLFIVFVDVPNYENNIIFTNIKCIPTLYSGTVFQKLMVGFFDK